MSYEEEDTCMSYEEEDTFMSYEEEENAVTCGPSSTKIRSCFCADEMEPTCAPSSDDVAGGPILHAQNCRVKARRVPSARPVVVVLQDEIHGVCLAVEQAEQTNPKHDALVAVPGCTARSAVARTRRHVARRAEGS